MSLCRFKCGRLAGTKSLINLDKSLLCIDSGILFKRSLNSLVIAEEFKDIGVRAESQRSDKGCDVNLSVLVYTNIEKVVLICLIFKPSTPVRDNGCGIKLLTGLVVSHIKIYAGRTNEL